VVARLGKGMLCLADRAFFRFALWAQAQENGANLLWRIRRNLRLSPDTRLADGSYLSRIYSSQWDFWHKTNGVVVRVIDYALGGVADAEPVYRLATTVLVPEQAPGLAALHHERWEIETAFDALKTHLRGARIVLRSKTPDLVRQSNAYPYVDSIGAGGSYISTAPHPTDCQDQTNPPSGARRGVLLIVRYSRPRL
jgi:phage tail protein X